MQLQTKRIFSILLLGVFVLYSTPKELYHAFTHHTDTVHKLVCSKDGLQISNEHHHCELLKIDQQFSAATIQIPFYDFSWKQFFFSIALKAMQEKCLHSNVYSCKQLRAPPFFVV